MLSVAIERVLPKDLLEGLRKALAVIASLVVYGGLLIVAQTFVPPLHGLINVRPTHIAWCLSAIDPMIAIANGMTQIQFNSIKGIIGILPCFIGMLAYGTYALKRSSLFKNCLMASGASIALNTAIFLQNGFLLQAIVRTVVMIAVSIIIEVGENRWQTE